MLLGPTGSGKSTIINNLFNLTVSKSGASAESVTRQVQFHGGSTSFTDVDKKVRVVKKINGMDTLGKLKFVLRHINYIFFQDFVIPFSLPTTFFRLSNHL